MAAIGEVDVRVLDSMESAVARVFELDTKRMSIAEPSDAFDAKRGQYSSVEMLRAVVKNAPADAARVVGVTERDLFIPMLTFVFGQAQFGGKCAVVSLARLRQEFYGLDRDEEMLLLRARKEASHELGHTFSLIHCPDHECAMSLSTNIQHVDEKADGFCMGCDEMLMEQLRSLK